MEQFTNSITNNLVKYKNWTTSNFLSLTTIVSGCYILKSIYDGYSSYSEANFLKKKIASIIKIETEKRKHLKKQDRKEKSSYKLASEGIQAFFVSKNITHSNIELSSTKSNNSNVVVGVDKEAEISKKKDDAEFFYFCFYKCLRTLFEKEFVKFEKERRELYKGNILKYISFCESFMGRMRLIEEDLFKIISNELKTDDDVKEIDCALISQRYYEDLDIEVNIELEKLNEIVVCLFDQAKENINKLMSVLGLVDKNVSDQEYLIAEMLAFDCIYEKYGLNETQVRKACATYNVTFEIVKN